MYPGFEVEGSAGRGWVDNGYYYYKRKVKMYKDAKHQFVLLSLCVVLNR